MAGKPISWRDTMSKLLESLLVLATPVLLAAPKKAAKKKVAPKKRVAKKAARKPKTNAAHGLTSDMRPTIGK
jgi:hypothetical protein